MVSGTGTLLQALIDACADPEYGVQIVAVGADRSGIAGLARAEQANIPTFVQPLNSYPDRMTWDNALTKTVASYQPDLIVLAGFLKLVGPSFLAQFAGTIINTHPALLPSFPGPHGVRDALAYGIQITGCTVFFVDADVDTGPIIAQRAVSVRPADTEQTLHERIKQHERNMLVDVVGRLCRHGWSINGRKVTIG